MVFRTALEMHLERDWRNDGATRHEWFKRNKKDPAEAAGSVNERSNRIRRSERTGRSQAVRFRCIANFTRPATSCISSLRIKLARYVSTVFGLSVRRAAISLART